MGLGPPMAVTVPQHPNRWLWGEAMLMNTSKEKHIFAQLCIFISVLWVFRVVGHAGRDATLSNPHF